MVQLRNPHALVIVAYYGYPLKYLPDPFGSA